MNLSKWLAVAVTAVALPGCLVALATTQSADASPTEHREFAYFNDPAHTTLVGEGYSSCAGWYIHMYWGTKTLYWEQTDQWLCYEPQY